jgi:hypothetical protein
MAKENHSLAFLWYCGWIEHNINVVTDIPFFLEEWADN